MIKIQDALSVEKKFFSSRDFSTLGSVVSDVLEDVKLNGDVALEKYSREFDKVPLKEFKVSEESLKNCAQKFMNQKKDVYDALLYSFDMALRFAKKQRECFTDFEIELESGVFTGQKNIPVERAGIYIPAGSFPLVSTVVMTVAPSIASGVKDIVLCTPPRLYPSASGGNASGGIASGENCAPPYADESIMAASYICGVKNVYACGGAQAIGAMAYGTKSIPKCDVIVGPGNKFVAEAKRIVYGTCGIDMVAGPTEVLIIADESANASWVSSDMLAQAEHDVVAEAVLVTTSMSFAKKVSEQIETQLNTLPEKSKNIARKSIDNFGRIIVVSSLEEAAQIANKKAPEHLELALSNKDVERVKNMMHNYGSLFMGHYAAEVLGDYASGLNHTLPTSGSARFTGGLSVRTFLKTVTTLRVKEGTSGFEKSARASVLLAEEEGLTSHARAAKVRI